MMVTDLLLSLFHFILIGFPTALRQVWRPWEQVIQKISVCVVFVFRYLVQEILHVFIDFQVVCFCSFGNAVDNGAGFGSADGIAASCAFRCKNRAVWILSHCCQGRLHHLQGIRADIFPDSRNRQRLFLSGILAGLHSGVFLPTQNKRQPGVSAPAVSCAAVRLV